MILDLARARGARGGANFANFRDRSGNARHGQFGQLPLGPNPTARFAARRALTRIRNGIQFRFFAQGEFV